MRYRLGIALATSLVLAGVLPSTTANAARKPSVAIAQTLALDGLPATSRSTVQGDPGGNPPYCTRVGRAELDRPDLHEGRLVHVIYMLPQGVDDEQLDTNGTLACSILTQNEWMRRESGLEWRWDTAIVDTASPSDPNARVETLDVTFVRSTKAAEALDSAGEVEAELIIRGMDDPGKRYLTYVASGSDAGICGDAFYPFAHHVAEVDGQFAQVYLDSAEACGARDFGTPSTGGGLSEAIAQQELMHNDGMTPIGAPHTCMNAGLPFAHVCTGPLFVLPEIDPEGRDVMFPYVWYPLREKVLDRGRDDYYGHGLPVAALETSDYLQPANAWGAPFVQPRDPGTAAPPPSPSDGGDVEPGERSIEISAARRRVPAGGRVAISGSVSSESSCAAGQRVLLQRRAVADGRSLRTIEATTAQDGSFAFRVKVDESTRFVAVAPAADDCPGATSRPVVVKAR